MAEQRTDWKKEYIGKHDLMIERGYEEVTPIAFYRDLFPQGSLQRAGEYGSGKGNMIVTVLGTEQRRSPQFFVGDDLAKLNEIDGSEYWLIDPISFFGRTHRKENAHELFAIVIDIDYVEVQHLKNMLKQFNNGVQLAPTYLASSGRGVHLYYFLHDPLPMYHEHERIYSELKKAFIRRLWNDTVSQLPTEQADIAGVVQGFRSVGSITRIGKGYPVRAFKISDSRYTLQQIKDSIPECKVDLSALERETIPLVVARLKYPDWYKRRIENKEPKHKKGDFVQHRRLYDWWKRKMQQEVRSGGRYYSIMALCSFGLKCGVSDREIRRDARGFLNYYESLTEDENNHFSAQDIEDALRALKKDRRDLTKKASRKWIEEKTKVTIEPQIRRNGRKRDEHLEYMKWSKERKKKNGLLKNDDGRPKKAAAVQEWRQNNPEGRQVDCMRDTGLSRSTVYRHWQRQDEQRKELRRLTDIVDFRYVESLADVNAELETLKEYLDTLTAAEQKEWYAQNKENADLLFDLMKETAAEMERDLQE